MGIRLKWFASWALALSLLLAVAASQSGACLAPCSTCLSGQPSTCTSCISSFVLTGGSCVSSSCQVLYCRYCSNSSSSTCMECQSNFILMNNTCVCQGSLTPSIPGNPTAICICPNNSTNCITCNIPGCLTCSNTTSCSKCGINYQLTQYNSCIQCNIQNCLSCLTNNFCSRCGGNLTVSNEGECVVCNMSSAGCLGCDNYGSCICGSGYELFSSAGTNFCYLCNVSNCAQCSPNQTCSSCLGGYSLSNQSGVVTCNVKKNTQLSCNSNCIQCTTGGSYGTCQYCRPPLQLYSCQLQPTIPFCSATAYPTSACLSCKRGYTFTQDQKSCYYTGYQYCASTVGGSCATCIGGYSFGPNGERCSLCNLGPACAACSNPLNAGSNQCLACIQGFYLAGSQCLPCMGICVTCTNGYSCDVFKPSSYDSQNPGNNVLGMFMQFLVQDGSKYAMAQCPSSCQICAAPTMQCTQCWPGWTMTSLGVCTQCDPSCLTCQWNNPEVCLSCGGGSFIPVGSTLCVQCNYPCMSCNTNGGQCYGCAAGYSLNVSTSSCVQYSCSIANCQLCANNSFCAQCLPGFMLWTNSSSNVSSCLPGLAACNNTYSTTALYCFSCYPGSYLDLQSSTCMDCPANCLTCMGVGTCTQCLDGYYITNLASMVCAPNCQAPCYTCLNGVPYSCTSCIAGFTLLNGICNPSNCSATASCSYCPLGQGMTSSQMCTYCNISNCASCSAQSNCTGCTVGYYLDSNNSCQRCQAYCQQCLDDQTCLICYSGSTKLLFPLTNGSSYSVCVSCNSPCQTCYGHPDACFSCVNGYNLVGTRCLSSVFVSGSLTSNASYAAFIQAYPSILMQIASMSGVAGATLSSIFPTGLNPNTSTYSFALSVPCNSTLANTSCASSIVTNLNTNFSSTTSLQNISITNFSFTVATGAGVNCSSPCVSCTISGGNICTSCPSGMLMSADTCLPSNCPFLYCGQCLYNRCVLCLPTFILQNNQCICPQQFKVNIFNSASSACVCDNSTGTCGVCYVANCDSCAPSTTQSCSICIPGYTLTKTGQCFACNVANCSSCSTINICIQCDNGTVITPSGACTLCSSANCQICGGDGECQVCAAGYTLAYSNVTNSSTCLQCNVNNCEQCNNTANICTLCLVRFTVTANGTCEPIANVTQCQAPCTYCANNTCISCITPTYSQRPDSQGRCFPCQVPGCIYCADNTTSACLICATGFVLNFTTQTCSPSPACAIFSTTSSQTCLQCRTLYVLADGVCVGCQVGQACIACSVLNLTVCSGCQYGFFLQNGLCYKCPALCTSCNATACLSYSSNVALIDNQPIISTSCLSPCLCTYSNNNYNNISTMICSACVSGYYLNNGNCFACTITSLCLTCNNTNPSQCLSCPDNAFLNNSGICQYCDPNCVSCVGANNCQICANGYSLNATVCVPAGTCSRYCLTCSTNNTCTLCYPGYYIANSGSVCVPILPGCLSAYAYNPSICLDCIPGTYLSIEMNNSVLSGVCLPCRNLCFACTNNVCLQCFDGYYLTGQSGIPCAPNCVYPCLSCSVANPTICFSCSTGYIFDTVASGQCLPVTNCSQSGCVVCPIGYILQPISTNCIACAATCQRCMATNTSICISCRDGFYLNNTQCMACMQGCTSCTSGGLCNTCGTGFVAVRTFFGNSQTGQPPVTQCTPCLYPCMQCLGMPDFCLSCMPYYAPLGGKCIYIQYYNVSVTVNSTLSNFLSNYANFTQQIANSVDPQGTLGYGIIFPYYLMSNSANSLTYMTLVSSICVNRPLCAQNEGNSIGNLARQSVIGNLSVIAASVNGMNFDNNGTNTTNTTNATCPPGCLLCSNITGACVNCSQGLTPLNGICVSLNCSVQYCAQCVNGSTCLQCNPLFILTNNTCVCQIDWNPVPLNSPNASCQCNPGNSTSNLQANGATLSQVVDACINCKITNCLQCSNATTCLQCASPYTLTNQSICVLCNIPDCAFCPSNNFCGQCEGALQVSASGDSCIACNVSNCRRCVSALKCAACNTGFVFNQEGTACINCSIPNCVKCQGSGICAQCFSGYQLVNSSSSCQISTCKPPCAVCSTSNSTVCTSCLPPFNPTPNNGQCFTCNAPNCFNCSFSNPSVCLNCSGTQFTLSNGSCQASCSQPQCLACSSPSVCTSCSTGYFISNGTCLLCQPGCATCTSTSSCSSCLGSFFLNGSTCVRCPSFCQQCTSTGSCEALSSNNQIGQTLIQVNGEVRLAKCDQGCQSCASNSPSVCQQCQSGFFLNANSVCQPCSASANCMTCSSGSSNACLTCFPNTFLSNGACVSCQFPCVTCQQSNTSSCLSCPKGYLLSNSSCLASQCPLFCQQCSSNSVCIQCMNSYVPINGTCTPCLAGCAQCSTTAPGVCLQCLSGTYLDPNSSVCIGCSPNCVNCLPNGCLECLDGFYLTDSLTCAQNCIDPCATCSTIDPSNCITCVLGYTFNSVALQNCQADVSCSINVSCVSCPLGYVLQNQVCAQCSSNCARCSANNPSVCTSCINGQYLNSTSGQCLNCPSSCSSCLSATVCLTCAYGFTSITTNANSDTAVVQCVACRSPCLTCLGSPRQCLTCASGYQLVQGKCQSNFNFGFNCTLSVDPAGFYQNYIPFLQALAQNVGEDYGSVAINTIRQSSTIVGGTVTTSASPQTATSQTQFNNMQNSLASNGQIAGMQVISSSVTANGGNPTETNPDDGGTAGWVIAVAVVVPLVVLIAASIGVYLYCKKKKQNSGQPQVNYDSSAASRQEQHNMEMSMSSSTKRAPML